MTKRKELEQRVLQAFPEWNRAGREGQTVYLHVGPTNSGKTHEALESLKTAAHGWYLAPLRLLAREVFERLNGQGVGCRLLTGEEEIPVKGAGLTAATVEMYNPREPADVVVLDEIQMLGDEGRGWAWTRALMETSAPELHAMGAAIAENLVIDLVSDTGRRVECQEHARKTPLQPAEQCWTIEKLPERTILVAFSRMSVLALKTELEQQYRRKVSVVYGNLPPEVRRMQADRFLKGETEICVATDAVGMGLNLPADNVCFFETSKFDGQTQRRLSDIEIQQIGGRAGRFGLSEGGRVGALQREDLRYIQAALEREPAPVKIAYVMPTNEALALLPGRLAERLADWCQMKGIPDTWSRRVRPADCTTQIHMAAMLDEDQERKLGLDTALTLVSAPVQEETISYWAMCARAIHYEEPMPIPPPVDAVSCHGDLEFAEKAISQADIYLWLSNRRAFAAFGAHRDLVIAGRRAAWTAVDDALRKKIDTARRCRKCGRKLKIDHRFSICDRCYAYGD